MKLLETEIAKYQKAWNSVYKGTSCGIRHVRTFSRLFDIKPNETVVDLGCGSGVALPELSKLGLQATGIDLVDTGYIVDYPFIQAPIWALPDVEFDYVFCVDVLEHIPEERVEQSIQNIARICCKGAFFIVATRPDNHGQTIGETLHMTVKPWAWWQLIIEKYFKTVRVDVCGNPEQEFHWIGEPLELVRPISK